MPKSPVFAAVLLTLGPLVSPPSALSSESGSPSRWRPPEDPRLRQSLAAVQRGLVQENLALLANLFPYRDKVLVRWDLPVRQDGLYTGSQVVLLFHELFKEYHTEQFSLQSGFLRPGSVYHCMAHWTLRTPSGQSQPVELHFSLRQDDGAWKIRELRQTR